MRVRGALAITSALALACATGAGAHTDSDTATARGANGTPIGITTVQGVVTGDFRADTPFSFLRLGPGRPYQVREAGVGAAVPGRTARRESLLYFGQFTDPQIVDEEALARVEFLDQTANPPGPGFASSAQRPQEAFVPHIVDQLVRQMNAFTTSPHADAAGRRAPMALTLLTGDLIDNQMRNETDWLIRLLEGREVTPNSGVADTSTYSPDCQALAAGGAFDPADAPNYTGVQDYDDYPGGADSGDRQYYDPDMPEGPFYSGWPEWTGLMDRAQQTFDATGLAMPSYITMGNHDGLAQGNEDAIAAYERLNLGCRKPLVRGAESQFADPSTLGPGETMFVPPDEQRQYVNKVQFKEIAGGTTQADRHGFARVDEAELEASNQAASYYSFDAGPRIRFIAIDTVSEGGTVNDSSNGNIDDPQFQWLERELVEATKADKLVVLFGHHPVRSLISDTPDEAASQCTADDEHGHDVNPGCDMDPRNSQPIHQGDDLVELLHRFPNAIAYIAGHTHENNVTPFPNPSGTGGFWGIETASDTDWPQQSRLLEIFDNNDGTLSIQSTILDHGAPIVAPPAGAAGAFSAAQLASIGRTLAYNDPQSGGPQDADTPGPNESELVDDNVELLVGNPLASTGGFADIDGFLCNNRVAPRSIIVKRTLRRGRGGLFIAGAARGRICVGPLGAARVYVAVGLQVPGGCRWLGRTDILTSRRSCREPLFVPASRHFYRAGRRFTIWAYLRRLDLPRGIYEMEIRSVDLLRHVELKRSLRRVYRFFGIP